MREPERSRDHVFDQTWNRMLDVSQAPSHAGPVSTVRVRIIGTAPETAQTAARADTFCKTKRYPSALPSCCDSVPPAPERDWRVLSARDVTLLDDQDEGEPALAFAHTVPAMTHEDLGIEESGVHAVDRLRLTLYPRDLPSVRQPAHNDACSATLRVKAQKPASIKRVWRRWEQQSPIITIGTAATFCFLSALLVSWLAP